VLLLCSLKLFYKSSSLYPASLWSEASIPPETMMHFPPCFRFPPYFRKILRLRGKFPKFYLFREIFRFSSAKISDELFLVIDHKFRISPLFFLFRYISSLFRENYYFPLLPKISTCFPKIHLLFTYFLCISFPPYFDHDAFMHHPCTYWTPLPMVKSCLTLVALDFCYLLPKLKLRCVDFNIKFKVMYPT